MNEVNPSGVFYKVHDIRVDELEKPEITKDSIILKVEKTGICGTDLHIYHEGLVPPGSVIGHEFVGEIIEAGEDVEGLEPGMRAIINPKLDGIGLGLKPGGFARYVRIDNAKKNINVFPVPDSINSEKGALIEPLSVGIAAINRTPFETTDNMLVNGCGTIGLVTIAGLKSRGVENIIASDISEKRLELAKLLGAKYVFNPMKDGDLKAFIIEKYGTVPSLSYGEDLPNLNTLFECSGVSVLLSQGISYMAPDGNVTVVAIYSKPMELDPNYIVYQRLRVKGTLFYRNEDILESIDLVASGKIDLTPIISHTFPLKELPKAFEVQADSKISVKVMISQD